MAQTPNAAVNGGTYVAYVFAHDDSDESMIKCGSFATDGSGNATVDLGFEPQWLLWKTSSASGDWFIHDTMRQFDANGHANLNPNKSSQEGNGTAYRINSKGFDVVGAGANQTRVYMAIRRPNKPAEEFEPEELFAVQEGDGSSDPGYLSGFPVDAVLNTQASGGNHLMLSRMTSQQLLVTSLTDAEQFNAAYTFDYSDGWFKSTTYPTAWANMWRRAPGFMDVVAYGPGNETVRTIPHNLAAIPEMMWFKRRNTTGDWYVYHKDINANQALTLNSNRSAFEPNAANPPWHPLNETPPTDSLITLGKDSTTNNNGDDYIAYLFASVPGISKVGSYDGSDQQVLVDCGFTTGPKFVLIKCVSGSGNWAVWDSERGLTVNGFSNPYVTLNTTDAQQAGSADSPYAASWGFSMAGNTLFNTPSNQYIFYAIA
jgi:hypothetical protein